MASPSVRRPGRPVSLEDLRESRRALEWLNRRLAWEHRFRELRGDVTRHSTDRVA